MFKIKIFTRVSVLSQVASRNLSTYWKFFPNLHLAPPLGVNCKYFWIFGTDTCKLLLIWLIFENICPQPVFSLSQPLHLVWIRHWLAHLTPTVTKANSSKSTKNPLNPLSFSLSLLLSFRNLSLKILESRIQQCCKWERSSDWVDSLIDEITFHAHYRI